MSPPPREKPRTLHVIVRQDQGAWPLVLLPHVTRTGGVLDPTDPRAMCAALSPPWDDPDFRWVHYRPAMERTHRASRDVVQYVLEHLTRMLPAVRLEPRLFAAARGAGAQIRERAEDGVL